MRLWPFWLVGVGCPYSDPLLKRCARVYANFCRKLAEPGLVEYRREGTERVGAFAVWKNSGRQRLVIDCRAANLHFEQPERVHLATGAFARLAVDRGLGRDGGREAQLGPLRSGGWFDNSGGRRSFWLRRLTTFFARQSRPVCQCPDAFHFLFQSLRRASAKASPAASSSALKDRG